MFMADMQYLGSCISEPQEDFATPESPFACSGNRLHGHPLLPRPVSLAILAGDCDHCPRHLIVVTELAVVEHLMCTQHTCECLMRMLWQVRGVLHLSWYTSEHSFA